METISHPVVAVAGEVWRLDVALLVAQMQTLDLPMRILLRRSQSRMRTVIDLRDADGVDTADQWLLEHLPGAMNHVSYRYCVLWMVLRESFSSPRIPTLWPRKQSLAPFAVFSDGWGAGRAPYTTRRVCANSVV